LNAVKVSAILLAAGLSKRMGGRDKLLLEYGGISLINRAVYLLNSLPVFEKILITTKARLPMINSNKPQIYINSSPETGQSSSMRLGVEAATGDYYFFLLADQPFLEVEDLMPLLDIAVSDIANIAASDIANITISDISNIAANNKRKIIYPLINDKACSPTLFHSSFREELLAQTGDTGGRLLRQAYPEACCGIKIKNGSKFLDIDYEEDYFKGL